MPDFSRYIANAIKLQVNTGTGAIMEGASIADNLLYAESAEVEVMHAWWEQPWLNGGEVYLTFSTDQAATYYIYVCDADLQVLQKETAAAVSGVTNAYECSFTLDNEGSIYVSSSDLTLAATLSAFEAKSNPLVFVENLKKVQFWNDVNTSLQVYYTSVPALVDEGTIYVPSKWQASRPMRSEKSENYTNSAGNEIDVVAGTYKERMLMTGLMPVFMHDILELAMRHHNLTIDGTTYKLLEYSTEEVEDYSLIAAQVKLQQVDSYNEIVYA